MKATVLAGILLLFTPVWLDAQVIVDLPGAELVVDGVDPRTLLVLDTPPVEDGAPPRVRIFVYQRNVERAAGSLDGMETELTAALEREVTGVFLEGQKPDKNQLN